MLHPLQNLEVRKTGKCASLRTGLGKWSKPRKNMGVSESSKYLPQEMVSVLEGSGGKGFAATDNNPDNSLIHVTITALGDNLRSFTPPLPLP